LLPAGLVEGWRRRSEPAIRFAICWLVPTWLAFELAPTKLAHYTLPTFGALAWLMAAALRRPLERTAMVGAALLGVAGLAFAAIAIYGLSRFGEAGDLTEA